MKLISNCCVYYFSKKIPSPPHMCIHTYYERIHEFWIGNSSSKGTVHPSISCPVPQNVDLCILYLWDPYSLANGRHKQGIRLRTRKWVKGFIPLLTPPPVYIGCDPLLKPKAPAWHLSSHISLGSSNNFHWLFWKPSQACNNISQGSLENLLRFSIL